MSSVNAIQLQTKLLKFKYICTYMNSRSKKIGAILSRFFYFCLQESFFGCSKNFLQY